MTAVRLLGPGDAAVLDRVVEGVFNNPINPRWRAEFVADLGASPLAPAERRPGL